MSRTITLDHRGFGVDLVPLGATVGAVIPRWAPALRLPLQL